MSASTASVVQLEPQWVSMDDYNALRHRGRCLECWKPLLHGHSERLAPMPAVRRTLVLFMHFRNVRRDGTLKDGGLEFYFCPNCRIEYAYGPRIGDGYYRLLRLP